MRGAAGTVLLGLFSYFAIAIWPRKTVEIFMSSSTLSSEALEQLNRENTNRTALRASAKFATGKDATRKASFTLKIEKTGKKEKQPSSKKHHDYDEHEYERFAKHVKAWVRSINVFKSEIPVAAQLLWLLMISKVRVLSLF